MQDIALVYTILGMLAVILVFSAVAYNSTAKRQDYDPIVKKWYRARSVWGGLLIIAIIVMCIVTLRHLPFERPTYAKGVQPVVVDVHAQQFAFKLSKTTLKAGQPIEFDVTSDDVNHGFGLYNSNNQVLAETQAMPNYTNKVYYTFKKPGTYKVLCLEYCGLGHHLMMTQFTVK